MCMIEDNDVDGALGVGIFCGDTRSARSRTTRSPTSRRTIDSGDHTRLGVAIQAHYGAEAELKGNEISGSPGGIAAFVEATIHHRR